MKRRIEYVRDFLRAARKYDLSPLQLFSRFYRLSVPELFSPNEIFRLGLLDAEDAFAVISRSMSKEALYRIQTSMNSRSHFHLTEDKLDFHAFCTMNGLPVPRLHAVFSSQGRTFGGLPSLRTLRDIEGFLSDCALGDLVIKPADGTHGEGVLVLSRQRDERWDDGKRSLSASEIGRLITTSVFTDWLFQERLFGAEALRELSGTTLLQTARVVTLVDQDGSCDVLLAWLRITAGAARIDNFNFGTAGHIVASIDANTGRLVMAAKMSLDGLGLVSVSAHPRSNHRVDGFRVPHWERVVSLATMAGQRFMPLKTVGWDIAITEEGPVLIEGNVTWDPLPANPDLAVARRKLESARGARDSGATA